jgi:hypothetical protein
MLISMRKVVDPVRDVAFQVRYRNNLAARPSRRAAHTVNDGFGESAIVHIL